MEAFYLCKNCVKPLRIKKRFESDSGNSNKNIGKCVICGENGIDISHRNDILQDIVDCIRFYYSVFRYFRKCLQYPYAAYFPSIINSYIFEEDNEILTKPLDSKSSKRLYDLLDSATNIHDIEMFDIIRSDKYEMLLEKFPYASHMKLPLKEADSVLIQKMQGDLQKHNYYEVEEKYTNAIASIISEFPQISIHGKMFYRARIGCHNESIAVDDFDTMIDFPYIEEEMMAPPPYIASAGRFNRQGCAFLYVANAKTTAIAELKPYVGCICSVAKIRCKDKRSYLDFRAASLPEIDDKINLVTLNIIRSLASFFRKPAIKDNDYLVSQFLSDIFIKLQCGGIIYDSVQTKGYNVLSYYPSDFVCVKKSEKMFEVKSVGYKINDIQDGRSKYEHWYFNDEKIEEKYGSDT